MTATASGLASAGHSLGADAAKQLAEDIRGLLQRWGDELCEWDRAIGIKDDYGAQDRLLAQLKALRAIIDLCPELREEYLQRGKRAGLFNAQTAEAIGLSRQRVSQIVSGDLAPEANQLAE